MKSGKIWGETERIFGRENVEVHRIAVAMGGYCSKHRHDHKWNLFFVEQGELEIEIWRPKSGLRDTTVLRQGESLAVAPGQFHRFTATQETVAYEIYWVDLDPADIKRESFGGVNKSREESLGASKERSKE